MKIREVQGKAAEALPVVGGIYAINGTSDNVDQSYRMLVVIHDDYYFIDMAEGIPTGRYSNLQQIAKDIPHVYVHVPNAELVIPRA